MTSDNQRETSFRRTPYQTTLKPQARHFTDQHTHARPKNALSVPIITLGMTVCSGVTAVIKKYALASSIATNVHIFHN